MSLQTAFKALRNLFGNGLDSSGLREEHERLAQMCSHLSTTLLMLDAKSLIVYDNRTGPTGLEASQKASSARSMLRVVHPKDRGKLIASHREVVKGSIDATVVVRCKDYAGGWRWMEVSFANRLKHIEVAAIIVSATDVSQRVTNEQVLQDERTLLTVMIDALPQSVAIKDAQGRYLRVNKSFLAQYGFESDTKVLGLLPSDFHEGKNGIDFEADDRLVMQEDESNICNVRLDNFNGVQGERWIELTRVPLRARFGGHFGLVSIARDISEYRNSHKQLVWQASHDALTGLPNRRALMDRLQVMQDNSSAYTLLYLDLDFFKTINDQYGHDVGDQLLVQMGKRISNQLRTQDLLARLGGDEFVIFRPGQDTEELAEAACERVLQALHEPVIIGGNRLKIECSVGIALSGDKVPPPKDMLRNADMAMYIAKERGRNQTSIFNDALRNKVQRKAAIAHALQFALDQDEFSLVYQPKFRLKDQKIVGMEALLRWNSRQLGVVSPTEFIPIAEESSIIRTIGRWVMAQACRQMARWQHELEGIHDVHMAVNVSTKQLLVEDFYDEVVSTLGTSGLDASALELEVTESAVMLNPVQAQMTLVRLKALGIRVALDDFGTGYSSLAYVRRLPLDVIKIDRSFITGLSLDDTDAEIIRTMLSFAQTRELETVAEGIESEIVANELRGMGCEVGQGYLFSKPLTSTAMHLLLADTYQMRKQIRSA